jgi:hypothetical protein
MIAAKIDRGEGRISLREWNYFCRGPQKIVEEDLVG